MSHFEERLEADLIAIRQWVWDMGEHVEKALLDSKKALLNRDEELAYQTVLGDNPINRESRECDRLCHTFIARHLPGAGHLREMAATIRVNVALERIGDYAVTISRESLQLDQDLPREFIHHIDALADESIQILHQSRVAFREGNAELARALMLTAKQVEGKMDGIYESLFDADSSFSARTTLAIFVVFNLLKRVADQAKNICDQTFYAVRGIAKVPKVYKILFISESAPALAQLAVSIGRKNFPTAASFSAATPGDPIEPDSELLSFLTDTTLPDENLVTEKLESLAHDLADYDVIVGLQTPVSSLVEQVPFHTTALNWSLNEQGGQASHADAYRVLRSEVTDLIDLLAGEEAA